MARILIAEDEYRIASFLEKGLRANGFSTAIVTDGLAAASAARDGGFDLVILDLGLPGQDGMQALAEIRRRGDSTFMSTRASGECPLRVSRGCGANGDRGARLASPGYDMEVEGEYPNTRSTSSRPRGPEIAALRGGRDLRLIANRRARVPTTADRRRHGHQS